MEQKLTSFKDFLKFGEDGEKEVAIQLIEKGINIMPLYQFTNKDKTPVLLTKNTQIIAPDLICYYKNKSFFVEVKTKNKWVVSKNYIETGLDYKHYLEYLKIKETTGLPVYLFFNHINEKPNGIFYVEISKNNRYWDGTIPNGIKYYTEMIFYKFDVLKEINTIFKNNINGKQLELQL